MPGTSSGSWGRSRTSLRWTVPGTSSKGLAELRHWLKDRQGLVHP